MIWNHGGWPCKGLPEPSPDRQRVKKVILLSLVVAVLAGGGVTGAKLWRERVIANLEERAFKCATKFLHDGKPLEAVTIIGEQPRSDVKFAWSKLELDSLVAARQVPRLVAIYGREPKRLLANEEGSLLVARALLAARQQDKFAQLRTAWQAHQTRPDLWLALDADVLDRTGKPREAEKLLLSKKFEGSAEATRLVRLALHAAKRSPYEAWTLLDQAFAVDPRNPEIRSFRAQILESIGKPTEARVEYVAALVADPQNPLQRDELAEFYRRQGSYDLALKTWRDTPHMHTTDFISLKESFWSRIIQPADSTDSKAPTTGALAPLVEFIHNLPADRFWDEEAFGKCAQNDRFTHDRQEIYWLRLLQLLTSGNEKEAGDLIRVNRFHDRSWRPELEAGLTVILNYRAHRPVAATDIATIKASNNQHPFLIQLAGFKTTGSAPVATPELATFLNSRNAFAAAFLAAGWREAALKLSDQTMTKPAPDWFSYGIAQCIRFNRGNQEALGFLTRQPRTPELVVLRGELLLAEKQVTDGRRDLELVATNDSAAGFRAAWLLSTESLEAGNLPLARATIQRQPRLATAIAGRELLARIELRGGNLTEADRLYKAIAEESVEARTFLARRAFARKDWPEARLQTKKLQQLMPDALQLRENMLAIDKAEKQK